MPVHKGNKQVVDDGHGSAPGPAEDDPELHVPEMAENMEHTLRRLVSERQKKRDETPGLYR